MEEPTDAPASGGGVRPSHKPRLSITTPREPRSIAPPEPEPALSPVAELEPILVQEAAPAVFRVEHAVIPTEQEEEEDAAAKDAQPEEKQQQPQPAAIPLGPGASALASAVSRLWALHEHTTLDDEVVVTRAAYTTQYVAMARALYRRVDDQEALRSAALDWTRDTRDTAGRMNLNTFTRATLAIADQWTNQAGWKEQAQFLNRLCDRMRGEDDEDPTTYKPRLTASSALTAKFTSLWRDKYGISQASAGSESPRASHSETERATHARVNRRRMHHADADNRVSTRGSQIYTHTEEHEATCTLQSLVASGSSNAITLYTPWQPAWTADEHAAVALQYQDLLPPQNEPVYTMRSRRETERAILHEARTHKLDTEWRAFVSIRPQSAQAHIAAGVHSNGSFMRRKEANLSRGAASAGGGIAASSLPVHASATGTTHISFIPYSVPTFPVTASATTTPHHLAQRPSADPQARLQPAPPLAARKRPHSAAAARAKHVAGHRSFVRQLTSAKHTPASLFEALLPTDECERTRVAGPLVAVPPEAASNGVAGTAAPSLLAVTVPARSSPPPQEEHHGGDAIPPPATGHVRPFLLVARRDSFLRPSPERPHSAVEHNQLPRAQQLVLREAEVERPLLLMSGEPATSPFVAVPTPAVATVDAGKPPRPHRERPVSAHVAQTLDHLVEASRQPRPYSAMHRPPSASFSSRPGTARRRYTATPSSVLAAQRPEPKVQREEEIKQSPAVPAPVSTDASDTFLTSLAQGFEEEEPEADSDRRALADAFANGADPFAHYVMPSRVKREEPEQEQRMVLREPEPESAVESMVESAADLEPMPPASPTLEAKPEPQDSPRSLTAFGSSGGGLDTALLSAHPILGLACLTVPPARPRDWPATVAAAGGVSLADRLRAVEQAASRDMVHSWAWFERLVSADQPVGEPTHSIIPSESKQSLEYVRANRLRASIYNSHAPEQTWLAAQDEMLDEQEQEASEEEQRLAPYHHHLSSSHSQTPAVLFDTLPAASVPSQFIGRTSADIRARKQRAVVTRHARTQSANIDLAIGPPEVEGHEASIVDVQNSAPLLLGRTSGMPRDEFPAEYAQSTFAASYAASTWARAPGSQLQVKRASSRPRAQGSSALREQRTARATQDARQSFRPRSQADQFNQPYLQQRPQTARPSTADPTGRHAHRHHAHNAMRGYDVDRAATRAEVFAAAAEPVLSSMPLEFPAPLAMRARVADPAVDPAAWWSRRAKVEHAQQRATAPVAAKQKGMVARQVAVPSATVAEPEAPREIAPSLPLAQAPHTVGAPTVVLATSDEPAQRAQHDHLYDHDEESQDEAEPSQPPAKASTTRPSSAFAPTAWVQAIASVAPLSPRAALAFAPHVPFVTPSAAAAAATLAAATAAAAAISAAANIQPFHSPMLIRDEDDDGEDADDAISGWASTRDTNGASTQPTPAEVKVVAAKGASGKVSARRVRSARPLSAHPSVRTPGQSGAIPPSPRRGPPSPLSNHRRPTPHPPTSASSRRVRSRSIGGLVAGSVPRHSRKSSAVDAVSTPIADGGLLVAPLHPSAPSVRSRAVVVPSIPPTAIAADFVTI